MSYSIDLDNANECIKNIVDSNRCGTCDRLDDLSRRCSCGRIICEGCASENDECTSCFNRFRTSTSKLVSDRTLSEKARNARMLMSTFEDAFKIPVYRRHRISEQLKIEKELFPECIQAPIKYSNRRKNLTRSYNKENSRLSSFLGEEVSLVEPKMEKTKLVQKWLNDNNSNIVTSTPRRPFSNINVNNQSFSSILNKSYKSLSRVTKSKKCEENKTTSKTLKLKPVVSAKKKLLKNKCPVEQSNFSPKLEAERVQHPNVPTNCNIQDESGIVLDDDCIVIDDTQSVTKHVDKDELALQAVMRAELNDSDYASFLASKEDQTFITKSKEENNFVTVPFFRRSSLYKTCKDCNAIEENATDLSNHSKNVSITIVYNIRDNKEIAKHSTLVQTDLSEKVNIDSPEHPNLKKDGIKIPEKIDNWETMSSQDIFLEDDKVYTDRKELEENSNTPSPCKISPQNRLQGTIIAESDSESDTELRSLHVTAEVHRSCKPEDYGVLTDMPPAELGNRKRHAARGVTPDSTDSSEKENFDPNRIKKLKSGKKGLKKDNLKYKI